MKNFFTLFYDDRKLRILKIERGAVVAYGQSPVPSGVVTQGKIVRRQQFAELLGQMLVKLGAKTVEPSFITVALPESEVFIKIVEIPKIPREKVEEAIQWQAETILPLAPEHLYLDWQEISRDAAAAKMKLLITACHRDVVDRLVETMALVSLVPISIKSESNALAMLYAQTPDQPVLIVNVGSADTSLVVAGNGVARFSTSTITTPDNLALVEKIRNVITFYQSNKREKPIAKIVLLGTLDFETLRQLIVQRLDLPVSYGGSPPPGTKIAIDRELYAYLATHDYLVPLGLAIEPLKGVNLLPEPIKQNLAVGVISSRFRLFEKVAGWTAAALTGSFALAFLLVMSGRGIGRVTATSVPQPSAALLSIEREVTSLNRRLDRIISLKGQTTNHVAVWDKVSALQAPGINIFSLGLKPGSQGATFTLTGQAVSRAELINFKEMLERQVGFEKVSFPLSNLEKPRDISFELEFSPNAST